MKMQIMEINEQSITNNIINRHLKVYKWERRCFYQIGLLINRFGLSLWGAAVVSWWGKQWIFISKNESAKLACRVNLTGFSKLATNEKTKANGWDACKKVSKQRRREETDLKVHYLQITIINIYINAWIPWNHLKINITAW